MTVKDAIKESKNGIQLTIHVVPGSSHTMFPAGYNQWRKCLEIKVTAEAKENKATNEVVTTVALYFHLRENDVVVVSGQKSREKTVCLKNISFEKVYKMLEESFHE